MPRANRSYVIDSEAHLWNCLVCLDLNMVRARAVQHPSEWRCAGYKGAAGSDQLK